MAVKYCEYCDKHIDLDYNPEHFDNNENCEAEKEDQGPTAYHLWRGVRRKKQHGESRPATREYKAWRAMKVRCSSKPSTTPNYKDYYGRGIRICPEWLYSYQNFLRDMGRAPTDKHTLDRVNNDGNYCKENCAWKTMAEQNKNKRPSSLCIIYKGETAGAASIRLGGGRHLVSVRVKMGWTKERAFTTPPIYRGQKRKSNEK